MAKINTPVIKISRKEQQVLHKLRLVMAAQKAETFTEEMLQNIDPDYSTIQSLVEKAILDIETGTLTDLAKYLQVQDDDPEVEAAWEAFRAVQGDGSMTKQYELNKAAVEASRQLEKVLFRKGRLVHMISADTHIWVTDGKVEFWKNKGYRLGNPEAVPITCQD